MLKIKNMLTKEQIEYLLSKGFKQDTKKHSGYYFYEDENKIMVLVPQRDSSFKLEFYELCYELDGGYYVDYNKEYSLDKQTLEDFINIWI